MLRYILTFVLVILMVETNAQTPFGATESNDKLLIRLVNSLPQTITNIQTKIGQDPDFSTNYSGNTGYLILEREPGSTITKQSAVNNYLTELYVASASFVYDMGDDDYVGIANDVFARVNPGVTATQVNTIAAQNGMISITNYHPSEGIYLITFDKNGTTLSRTLNLIQSGLFEYVEPNYFTNTLTPNYIGNRTNSSGCEMSVNTFDSYIQDNSQWSLFTDYQYNWNTNFMLPGAKEWSDINVCNAWNFMEGSTTSIVNVNGTGIIVAVLDDGVDATHYELQSNIKMNGGVVDGFDAMPRNTPINTDPASPDLYANHGTLCAGIIAAERNNTNAPSSLYPGDPYHGMAGIANKANIMPIRIWSVDQGANGGLIYNTTSQAVDDGIRWAADAGADVLSNSWGGFSGGFSIVDDAIDYAVTSGRGGKGCVVVFSSGNNNCNNINWPSSHSETISVGASTMCNEKKQAGAPNYPPPAGLCPPYDNMYLSCDGERNWGSNYGDGRTLVDPLNNRSVNTTDRLSILAPGVRIVSTLPGDAFSQSFNGTSSSAPHVSAVAAMILSVNECLTYKEVREIIEVSTDKMQPDPSNLFYPYNYASPDGYSAYAGYGKVNAGNAVTIAYDLYKQATTEVGTKVYRGAHYIYAGRNLTDILPMTSSAFFGSDYVIANGANIEFYVPTSQAILLEPGFEALDGSKFFAEPQTSICDNSEYHLKQPKNDNGITADNRSLPGIQQMQSLASSIKVYPNPAKNVLNIEFYLEESSEVNISIVNMLGQQVVSVIKGELIRGKNKKQVSIDHIASGVYFVRIKTNKGLEQIKFVKQ